MEGADDDQLAALQAALLDLLDRADDLDALRAALLAHPACAAHRDWIASFEPRMLAVAVELVHTWGLRGPGPRRAGRRGAGALLSAK